jgi:LmbE family N-acetylglucosaminyl deacetylase
VPRTLVCFHAHPDDEAIATGGVMARAAADGHRVVLVVATRGELGEVAEGFLDDGESLTDRRVAETHRAAGILGATRVEFLGYHDSGMMGEATNADEACFWRADVEEAARRLALILEAEAADVLTVYDDNGNYGHPDHIQVHRVGVRASELAGTPRVYEATVNRDEVRRQMVAFADLRQQESALADGLPEDPEDFDIGVPESRLTTCVDVTAHVATKRAAMRAHASQISETSVFLAMPDEAFAAIFGQEWFIRRDREPGPPWEHDLFEGLT